MTKKKDFEIFFVDKKIFLKFLKMYDKRNEMSYKIFLNIFEKLYDKRKTPDKKFTLSINFFRKSIESIEKY
jgi:hypothetical protein